MKKSFFSYAVLAVLLLMTACSKEKNYVNVVPADASLVFSADVSRLAEKVGLSDADKLLLVQELNGAVQKEMGAEDAAVMKKVFEKPDEGGLNLEDKIYGFYQKSGNIGVVVSVADQEKAVNFLNVVMKQEGGEALSEKAGCYWGTMNGICVACDKEVLLFVASENARDMEGLKEKAEDWMKADPQKSFASTDLFKEMSRMEGDMALACSLDCLSGTYGTLLKMNFPQNVDLKDMQYVMALNFEKGKMVLEGKAIYASEELRKFAERQAEVSGRMSGKYLKMFPENSFVWAGGNMKGDKFYEALCQVPQFSQLAGMGGALPVDIKKMIESLDGDIVVGLADVTDARPRMALLADVKNASIVEELEKLKPMLGSLGNRIRLVETGEKGYELLLSDGRMFGMGSGPLSIAFGVKDDMFYLTTDAALIKDGVEGNTLEEAAWAGEVDGSYGFAAVNYHALGDMLLPLGRSSDRAVMEIVLKNISYLTACAEEREKLRIVLGSGNEETNILHQWVDMAKQLSAVKK